MGGFCIFIHIECTFLTLAKITSGIRLLAKHHSTISRFEIIFLIVQFYYEKFGFLSLIGSCKRPEFCLHNQKATPTVYGSLIELVPAGCCVEWVLMPRPRVGLPPHPLYRVLPPLCGLVVPVFLVHGILFHRIFARLTLFLPSNFTVCHTEVQRG